MIIGKYIRQLLNDSKRVVFPGFGNLEVKEVKGEVSQTGSKINPPGLTVKFDSGYSKDDGLLAATMLYGEGIQQEEADQKVLELIDAIKFALDKGEPYLVHETGTFLKDDDGKVHFQAVSEWVLEPDHYGLESLDLLELEELPLEEENRAVDVSVKPPPRAPVRAPELQPAGRTGRHITRWRAIYITAGTLIVILAVLIFIPIGRKGNPTKESRIQKKSPPIETIQQNKQLREEKDNAAEVAAPESQEVQGESVDATPNYYIIAGSFKHLKNASEMQDQLKARGYKSEVLITENRMYRVSVASYATVAEAERVLSEIKSEPGLKSCWVLSN